MKCSQLSAILYSSNIIKEKNYKYSAYYTMDNSSFHLLTNEKEKKMKRMYQVILNDKANILKY